MRIIPVLDLMNGQVVRGVGGRRQEYRPIISTLTSSHAPLDVACAFRARFQLRELYVADLDAIAGAEPAWATYKGLHSEGFRLWVDAGIRHAVQAQTLADAGIEGVVAGLETLAGPNDLAQMVQRLGERIIFSLDLRDGVPLGNPDEWTNRDAWTIATQALELGVRRLLVLDLASVGGSLGSVAAYLGTAVAIAYPEVEVSLGGGIRARSDVLRLSDSGVQAVLLASALHDGVLSAADLAGL
jgi:phosphoribosylformimino-5-aminoimidazole carboxamide ribotide isomerase